MTNVIIPGYDTIGANEHLLPTDLFALGYDTEVGPNAGIKWSAAQFARHTNPYPASHIDQDPGASDPLADWLDVEAGAANEGEIVGWLERAQADWHAGIRPGQRWPGLYMSESNVPGAVVILERAGALIERPVPFWVANYSISHDEAVRRVASALGPYPAYGYQYDDHALSGIADASVFALNWVTSFAGPVQPPAPTWTDTLVQNLPTLTEGNTTANQDVRDMQGLLNSWKFATLIDGYFGPKTKANVIAFQGAVGIAKDGVVGEATWQKLLNRLCHDFSSAIRRANRTRSIPRIGRQSAGGSSKSSGFSPRNIRRQRTTCSSSTSGRCSFLTSILLAVRNPTGAATPSINGVMILISTGPCAG